MYIEQENFLTTEECDEAIRIHRKFFDNSEFSEVHGDTKVFNGYRSLFTHNDFPEKIFLRKILAMVSGHIQQINRESFVNYFQIVEWPKNSSQGSHKDFYEHPYTSIIYLNDDYSGGNTYIEKKLITPKSGKIITFNGSINEHGVLPITNGVRYTIPIWYTMNRKLIDIYMANIKSKL